MNQVQGFTYSVLPYKVMYMDVYGHITKCHEGNACPGGGGGDGLNPGVHIYKSQT